MHPFMDVHSDADQFFMIKIVQRKNIDIDIAIFALDISISETFNDIDPSLGSSAFPICISRRTLKLRDFIPFFLT